MKDEKIEKIEVTLDGKIVPLGEELRNLITSKEKEKKKIELQLNYFDAINEKPSTVLRNLEKIGVINWIPPQFKTPSWALPLAQYSKLSSQTDLWYVLMDPYKYVKIRTQARQMLSSRLIMEEGIVSSAIYCFIPLPIKTTFGYASLTNTHFQRGCDVKAINVRRSDCDSSNAKRLHSAFLSPDLYDYLQNRIWYPEEEASSAVTVFEKKTFEDISDGFELQGEFTSYLFDGDGSLRKTCTFPLEVKIILSDNLEGTYKNGIVQSLLSNFHKKTDQYNNLEISGDLFVLTTAGIVKSEAMVQIDFQNHVPKSFMAEVSSFWINETFIKGACGINRDMQSVMNFRYASTTGKVKVKISENIFGHNVYSCNEQHKKLAMTEKSMGPFQGNLSGNANFSQKGS